MPDGVPLPRPGCRPARRRPPRHEQPLRPGRPRRPRELPIEGSPADVVEIAEAYTAWLAASDVPKLFVNGEPGALLTGEQRERVRSFPNQTEVTVAGSHFLQEDSPDEIGQAIADWLPTR